MKNTVRMLVACAFLPSLAFADSVLMLAVQGSHGTETIAAPLTSDVMDKIEHDPYYRYECSPQSAPGIFVSVSKTPYQQWELKVLTSVSASENSQRNLSASSSSSHITDLNLMFSDTSVSPGSLALIGVSAAIQKMPKGEAPHVSEKCQVRYVNEH